MVVCSRQDPSFVSKPAGKWAEGDELIGFGRDAHSIVDLLPHQITKYAALYRFEMSASCIQLDIDFGGHDAGREQLAMHMFQCRAAAASAVFKEQRIIQSRFAAQCVQ